MNTETKSFLFSFALHMSVMAVAVSFAGVHPPGNAPVLIDFMVENGQGTKEKSIMKDPGGGPVTAPEAINPAATERVKAPTGGP
ncbi:MAG: hypothetical protein VB050_08755 [Geobacteraceae bacterium]|nr:hypothetical protein [Geobacteraceae bacterium]